jgi:diadenosine tetraphosphate (Ap4A) HIT family hydrolase
MRDAYYHGVMANLKECPFCHLKDKYLIAEQNGVVLAVNLFPYTDYHLMVITRRHVEDLSALTKQEWRAIYGLSQLGLKLIERAWGEKNVNILYREGKKAGKSLGHWHWHLIPFVNESFEFKSFKVKVEPLKAAKQLRRWMKSGKHAKIDAESFKLSSG